MTRPQSIALTTVLGVLSAGNVVSVWISYSASPRPRPYGLDARPLARPFLDMPSDDHGVLPPLLSHTGAFKDTRTLAPSDALIPYDLIVPFWSDGAGKQRWIALPADRAGAARIGFSPTGAWSFPTGTVLVKHFELPPTEAGGHSRRLETRVLVCDGSGGVYRAAYKWRQDDSDADLVREGIVESIPLGIGPPAVQRTWYYPGVADCRTCHTSQAGGVLGIIADADPVGLWRFTCQNGSR